MMSSVPPSAPAPPGAPVGAVPPNYYAPGPYQAPPQSGAAYYPNGPPSCYGGPPQPYYGGPPQPIMMCAPAPAPAPAAASAAASASSGQQQQQQSSTSVVVVGMGDKGKATVFEHYYWAMALGCMVFWCCNPICGAIAFFLATMAEQTGTLDDSRRFAKFSVGASVMGAITGVIIIVVTVGVVVGGAAHTTSSSSSSSSSGSSGQYPGPMPQSGNQMQSGENIPVNGGQGERITPYFRASTPDMPTLRTSRWNDQWPGFPQGEPV